jgi:hypothetical protein
MHFQAMQERQPMGRMQRLRAKPFKIAQTKV